VRNVMRMKEEKTVGPSGRGVGTKLKIVLLVALLFGAPALVTAALLATDFGGAVADAAQPGGKVRGLLVDSDGRGVGGVDVELSVVSASGGQTEGPSTMSASDGTFALEAEPVQGHYELRAGGGNWQRVVKAYSFLDANKKPIESDVARIVLRPGCRLELEFARADESAAGDGDYTLQGEFGDGLFFGFLKPQMKTSGDIKGGRLTLAGLPPMKANIFVKMSSGETVELTLDLEPGMNKKRIKI
jgi:hypothetical protein